MRYLSHRLPLVSRTPFPAHEAVRRLPLVSRTPFPAHEAVRSVPLVSRTPFPAHHKHLATLLVLEVCWCEFLFHRHTETTCRLRFYVLKPPVHQFVTQPPRAAATKNEGTAIGQIRNDWVRGSCKGDPCSRNEKRGCCDFGDSETIG